MRGERDVDAVGGQPVGERDERVVGRRTPRVGVSGALDVGALDQPDRDALGGEPVGVGDGAAQVGLERELDRQAAARRRHAESVDAVGRRRLLGADLQAAPRRDGLQDPVERGGVERDVREIERDPGRRVGQPRAEPLVGGRHDRRLLERAALAEQVDARRQTRSREPAGSRDRIVDPLTGEVPARGSPGTVRAAGERSHRALERVTGGEPEERAAADYGASTFSLRVTPKLPPAARGDGVLLRCPALGDPGPLAVVAVGPHPREDRRDTRELVLVRERLRHSVT